ncbi:MAG TPA: serine hydrolase [Steroidobacteraceae bacterium]|nr:serine hydrolase [Steroidobacteraceae bacterium]
MSRSPPLAVVLALLLAGCGGGGGNYPDYEHPKLAATFTVAPENTGDGWTVSTPAAEGLNTQALDSLYQSIRDGHFPGVDSMIVVRHQHLVAEGYFNGFGRDTVHELRSTGKSFISTLAGIALDQGLIGLDDPLAQHIPDFEGYRNMSAAKRSITLRHLLNMNSGLDCDDWIAGSPGNEERMYDSRDWIRFMLDLRMMAEPGAEPHYCTGGVVLLAHVMSLRSGMALENYAQQWLLGPLNIQQSVWRHSPDGRATGATGFGLRPRDAAKLGALVVNEGVWNGVRVVPESWVMITRQRVLTLGSGGYGYLWWKSSFPRGAGQVDAVFTSGNGGNHVFTVPSLELVVAFTGSNYNTERSQTPEQMLPLVLAAVQ